MIRGVGYCTGKLAPALKNYPVTAQPGLVLANWLCPISKKRSNLYVKWAPGSLQLYRFGCFTEVQLSEAESNAKSELEERISSVSIVLSLSWGGKNLSGPPFFPDRNDASSRYLHMVVRCPLPPSKDYSDIPTISWECRGWWVREHLEYFPHSF